MDYRKITKYVATLHANGISLKRRLTYFYYKIKYILLYLIMQSNISNNVFKLNHSTFIKWFGQILKDMKRRTISMVFLKKKCYYLKEHKNCNEKHCRSHQNSSTKLYPQNYAPIELQKLKTTIYGGFANAMLAVRSFIRWELFKKNGIACSNGWAFNI